MKLQKLNSVNSEALSKEEMQFLQGGAQYDETSSTENPHQNGYCDRAWYDITYNHQLPKEYWDQHDYYSIADVVCATK
jgi:hypothetical protein